MRGLEHSTHFPGLVVVVVGRGLRGRSLSVQLDSAHLARPQVQNLSPSPPQFPLGSLVLGQLGVSARRDQGASSPVTTVLGAGAGLSACDTMTLTVMAEWLCAGSRRLVMCGHPTATELVGDSRHVSEKRGIKLVRLFLGPDFSLYVACPDLAGQTWTTARDPASSSAPDHMDIEPWNICGPSLPPLRVGWTLGSGSETRAGIHPQTGAESRAECGGAV